MIPKDNRERIILGGTLLLTFVVSVLVFFVAGLHGWALRDRSARRGVDIATAAAQRLSETPSDDPAALQEIAEEASNEQDVLFAIIADQHGETLAVNEHAEELFPAAISARSTEILEHEDSLQHRGRLKTADGDEIEAVEVIVPVRIEGQFHQAVRIGVSLATTYADLGAFRRRLTLLAVLGLIFGAVGFTVLVNSVLPSPPAEHPA